MKFEEINNILAKKITGEATSSDIAILDKWRALSADNQAVYAEYEQLWDSMKEYEPTNFEPNFESALDKHLDLISEDKSTVISLEPTLVTPTIKDEIKTSFFSLKRISSIAAIFVLGIAALFLMNNSSNTITAENGVQFVSLDDGSQVWLDEGSSLSYKRGFGKDHRDLTLEGKAFFDVNRNENLPFNIKEQDLVVSVLGTSFTVDGFSDAVTVNTGRVAVDANNDQVILTKNQKVTLKNDKLETSVSNDDSAKWRNSNLSFDSAPLTQVIADVNMYHGNQIELDVNSTTMDCPFTSGGLSSESLDNIIKILEKSYDMSSSKTLDGKIKLVISSCE